MLTLSYAQTLARQALAMPDLAFSWGNARCTRYGWILFFAEPHAGAVVVAHDGRVVPLDASSIDQSLRAFERAIGYARRD